MGLPRRLPGGHRAGLRPADHFTVFIGLSSKLSQAEQSRGSTDPRPSKIFALYFLGSPCPDRAFSEPCADSLPDEAFIPATLKPKKATEGCEGLVERDHSLRKVHDEQDNSIAFRFSEGIVGKSPKGPVRRGQARGGD